MDGHQCCACLCLLTVLVSRDWKNSVLLVWDLKGKKLTRDYLSSPGNCLDHRVRKLSPSSGVSRNRGRSSLPLSRDIRRVAPHWAIYFHRQRLRSGSPRLAKHTLERWGHNTLRQDLIRFRSPLVRLILETKGARGTFGGLLKSLVSRRFVWRPVQAATSEL